ncbi:MAG: hypothetical protein V4640_15685 [Verrucomicrobiota bacterium]
MKLLLGATIALLLGALAVSWQGMNTGVKNAPASDVARIEKQLKELLAEQDKLELERQMRLLQTNSPTTPTASSADDLAAIRAAVESQAAARAAEEAAKANRDAMVEDAEELEADKRNLESTDSELRRARMISEALLMGKVKEYVEDPQYGGFVTFDVLMPEQVQTGTILAIRRKTGILGLLKVSDVTLEGAIANPLPGFGPVSPEVGDELILPPQY